MSRREFGPGFTLHAVTPTRRRAAPLCLLAGVAVCVALACGLVLVVLHRFGVWP